MIRLTLFGVAVSFSLAMALHPSVLFWHWQPTFIFVDQVSCLVTFQDGHLHPPYRQLAFLGSSQVTALESALQLQLPREAFLATSLRPWIAGRVKLIFCMCAHPWTPSFWWLVEYLLGMILTLTNGIQWLGGCLHCFMGLSLCLQHEPHSLWAGCCFARGSLSMVWGLMAGLPGFASHGSSLYLEVGCQ